MLVYLTPNYLTDMD